ncbi:MAG: YkgJ family cysteine cluster protein [Acidobacteria bacterium]|nr:YkgJ family cysteine cluster protein [Acidobacteriota bacterium]
MREGTTYALRVIIKWMNEAHLIQITRRRQIGGRTFERVVEHLVAEMSKRTAKPQIAAERLSGRLADRVVDAPAGVTLDCRTCGACCTFYTCVAVEETDCVPRSHYWKIGERGSLPAPIARRQLRRDPVTNTCLGLEGEIGSSVRCGIYSRRPAACRDFEAGSDQCHAARRAFELEPPLTAEQLAEALGRLAARESEERRREAINPVGLTRIIGKREWAVEVIDKEASGDIEARPEAA